MRHAVVLALLVVCAVGAVIIWRRPGIDSLLVATVRRGELTATLTTTGTLRPIKSITYRSPINGREAEIRELAPEGTRVNEGDLLVGLETTDLEHDFDRVQQELRQSQIDLQVAEGEWDEAQGAVKAVNEGEGALTVEEARSVLQRAEKKVERLREEYTKLKPLLDRGFMTREELAKTRVQLEESEDELGLARKRTDIVVELAHPREKQRAALQLSQKAAQLGHARTRVQETQLRLTQLRQLIDACSIYARGPGLVVYEEFLSANPRRKLRIGDRVFSSQGIVTIPEVNRMLVEASVGEGQVHRVRKGQRAAVRVEAFPGLRLTGTVSRVGTLASASVNRPFDDKRFDLMIDLDPTSADLRPEMTVGADVVVGTRQSVLLVPVTAVFDRQGSFVAYVVGATSVETRPVDLGESNNQVVEVVAGLREGERVSLVAPATAAPSASATAPGRNPVRGNGLQPR
jgi:multidrug resistance efflux pump